MSRTKVNAKATNPGPVELHEEALSDVAGGLIGLLLPAVQKVRDAAAKPAIVDGTSNTITP